MRWWWPFKPQVDVTILTMPVVGKGKSTKTTLQTGETVRQVLQRAGYDPQGMEVSVNDKPITNLDAMVGAGQKVRIRSIKQVFERVPIRVVRVNLTERPAGS